MFDADFINNPYPTYQHLLATGRLHWVEYLGGAWFVPHYDDVMLLLRDPRLSSNWASATVRQFPPEQWAQLQDFQQHFAQSLVLKDGQEHLRLRRLLNKAFTPRVIERLRPRIVELTNELVDRAIQHASGHQIELMQQIAHPLPALVIAELLGVAAEDQQQFVHWSDDIAFFIGSARPTFEHAIKAQQSLRAMTDYFRAIVAEQRQHPTDNLISLLIEVEEQGDVLTEAELLSQCTLFLTAGHETTRNLIGNGLLSLLQHPVQRKLLERNPGLLRRAVHEMARYESPVQVIVRMVAEDFELHGTQLQRGQVVVLMTGAANRDPAQFPGPNSFDITRTDSRPLTFGHGPHICIGMTLAYLETEIVLATLLQRLPNVRLHSRTPDWNNNFMLRGLHRLPLKYDPIAAALKADSDRAREAGGSRS